MVGFPTPDKYDLGVVGATVVLLLVGYVVTSSHLVRISVWFTIFTIYVCYMGYLAHKLTFDEF